MPVYRRYRRSAYRRRRYPYRRRYRRSYARKYVNASSRSQVRIKTAVESNFTLSSGTASGPGAVKEICPLLSSAPDNGAVSSALRSPLYRTYCALYEEVKIIGFKTQISIASAIGGSDIPSLQIYTAFDRRHGANEAIPTAAEIKNSSSYLVATALNNNVAKLTRSIYASDLLEKAQWHDCTLGLAGGIYSDTAYVASGANPNFFVPELAICFQSPTLAQAVDVKVNASTVFYFAFRNPKYGAGATGSAKVQSLGGVFHDPSAPDGDGDVDDVAMRDVAPAAAAAAAAAVEDPIEDDQMVVNVEHEPTQLDVAPVRHAVARINPGPLAAGEKRYGPRRPKNV